MGEAFPVEGRSETRRCGGRGALRREDGDEGACGRGGSPFLSNVPHSNLQTDVWNQESRKVGMEWLIFDSLQEGERSDRCSLGARRPPSLLRPFLHSWRFVEFVVQVLWIFDHEGHEWSRRELRAVHWPDGHRPTLQALQSRAPSAMARHHFSKSGGSPFLSCIPAFLIQISKAMEEGNQESRTAGTGWLRQADLRPPPLTDSRSVDFQRFFGTFPTIQ